MNNMLSMNRRRLLGSLAATSLGAAGSGVAGLARAQTPGTLRAVVASDLRSLDPVTTPGVTIQHALMVYDVLFARNHALEVKPQMVADWTVGDTEYRFTLRPGLEFHDGSKVTSADVVASYRRWSQRSASGQLLATLVAEAREDGPTSFVIVLKRKFPAFLEVLCDPVTPMFVMRQADAAKPATEAVTTAIGSGPFRFVPREWLQGSRVVYVRNPNYVGRTEPASGWAGNATAKVERVEWISIPDPATQVAALRTGEVHMIENIAGEQILEARKDSRIELLDNPGRGAYTLAILNQLHPPFDNVKARQAMLHLVDQDELMLGATGSPALYEKCHSFFACNSPYASDEGAAPYRRPDPAAAARLFAEAGYRGEPIVIMMAAEQPIWLNISQVLLAALRKVPSLNVRPVSMDWGALVARRANKSPPGSGGWSIFVTTGASTSLSNPLMHFFGRANCDNAWFGWPCDEQAEQMRTSWGDLATDAERKAAARALQARWFQQTVPFVPLGFMKTTTAYRKDMIRGVLSTPLRAPQWNIELLT